MCEETEVLRRNLSDMTSQNDTLRSEFFGNNAENYQTQVSTHLCMYLLLTTSTRNVRKNDIIEAA